MRRSTFSLTFSLEFYPVSAVREQMAFPGIGITYAIFADFLPPAFKLLDSSRSVISAAETGIP